MYKCKKKLGISLLVAKTFNEAHFGITDIMMSSLYFSILVYL